MSLITEEMRAKAEMYYGDKICQEKAKELLRTVELPNGVLPLKDMIECGIVRETNFVWMKQKKSITHKFDKINRLVTYDQEVTAVVDLRKIKKLTGVKAKELLVWLTVDDVSVNCDKSKMTFQTPTGFSRTFPASAFVLEGDEELTE